jgi:hypothetical protein
LENDQVPIDWNNIELAGDNNIDLLIAYKTRDIKNENALVIVKFSNTTVSRIYEVTKNDFLIPIENEKQQQQSLQQPLQPLQSTN